MTVKRLTLGKQGEKLAQEYLKRQGYVIIITNFSNQLGEIDIIATDGDTLCFVEVRTRTSSWHGHPFESVTRTKQCKIIRVAQSYLQMKYGNDDVKARFDVVGIIPETGDKFKIDIIKNAFEV